MLGNGDFLKTIKASKPGQRMNANGSLRPNCYINRSCDPPICNFFWAKILSVKGVGGYPHNRQNPQSSTWPPPQLDACGESVWWDPDPLNLFSCGTKSISSWMKKRLNNTIQIWKSNTVKAEGHQEYQYHSFNLMTCTGIRKFWHSPLYFRFSFIFSNQQRHRNLPNFPDEMPRRRIIW